MGRDIKVFCRIKPGNSVGSNVGIREGRNVEITTSNGKRVRYVYDQVFSVGASQRDIYNEGVRDLIEGSVDGSSAAVIAYGQTGSGKSYTMFGNIGNAEDRGLIPRAIEQLLNTEGVVLKMTIIEIYMEKVRDLLGFKENPQKLSLREASDGSFYVEGAREVEVRTPGQGLGILNQSCAARVSAKTRMNDRSSRGHLVCTLSVTGRLGKKATVNFFDLAGSEKWDAISADGSSAHSGRESQYINKSLSALGNVICSLHLSRSHIPYRDSKITLLLKKDLSLGSRVHLILNCSAEPSCTHVTAETLRFGSRVANTTRPVITHPNPDDISLLEENNALRKRVAQLESIISNTTVLCTSKSPSTPRLSHPISAQDSGQESSPEKVFLSTPPTTPKLAEAMATKIPHSPANCGLISPIIRKVFEEDPEFLHQLEERHRSICERET